MRINTVCSVALLQLKRTILSPKAWVALFIAALIGATAGWDHLTVAGQLGYPFQTFEPFITLLTRRVTTVFVVVGIALMLSDAPFTDASTYYLVFRTHRRAWMIGIALHMLLTCFIYLLVILLSSVLIGLPFSYIQNQWSPLSQLLCTDQTLFRLRSHAFINSSLINAMTPYRACFAQLGLTALYALCVCALMLAVNARGNRAGFAFAMLFHGLMLVMHMDGHPIGSRISLFTYASLNSHFHSGLHSGASFAIFLGFALCVYGLSIGLARRMDI
ncbi:MAG: hypothetical protein VB067_10540 [Christensenellaceae bacterium]|nr:hypothetical protein [Christensenellaceae bacterium]MEA5069418.1 hypothetical protein [Christensenellaceae bacterium]